MLQELKDCQAQKTTGIHPLNVSRDLNRFLGGDGCCDVGDAEEDDEDGGAADAAAAADDDDDGGGWEDEEDGDDVCSSLGPL